MSIASARLTIAGVAPRGPGEIVGPRRPADVVVRPLNFTVRARH
jgi:hypothetical protein